MWNYNRFVFINCPDAGCVNVTLRYFKTWIYGYSERTVMVPDRFTQKLESFENSCFLNLPVAVLISSIIINPHL